MALLVFWSILTSAAVALTGGGRCSTTLDCWLNGDCTSGACLCDIAWTGPACDILAELPATQLYPFADPLPANVSTLPSSWGASVVVGDDGLFHAFVETVCRSFTWMHIAGSVVVHITSPSLTGPYTFRDVALPQQSMTPHIVRDNDGAWLLLHQRNTSAPPGLWPECSNGSAPTALGEGGVWSNPPPNSTFFDGPPSIARSMSLDGPWAAFDFNITPPLGRMIDNPNPSLLPLPTELGGGYLLAFTHRSIPPEPYNEAVSIAFADDWRSGLFTPLGDSATSFGVIDCEDPHLYRTTRGCHVVCHRRTDANNSWHYPDVGGYGVSANCRNWTFHPNSIYSTSVPWAQNGGAPILFARRERPEFIMGADGKPASLVNGVEWTTGAMGQPSLSIITPLGPPPPPPNPPPRLYAVNVTSKSPRPILSRGLPVGGGSSPCNLTFNPAFVPARLPALNKSIVIVRASGCPPEYGGAADHLMYAECEDDGSACDDLNPTPFPFEYLAEDPRIYFNALDGYYYLSYFANGTNQSTVNWRRTVTPLDMGSWEILSTNLPWHRNGCAFFANGQHFVIYGETYYPAYPGRYIKGIGLATTTDFKTFTVVNDTLMLPVPVGPDPEVCLEAATPPVQLSTGDWLHIFAAGTQGWGPWGPGEVMGSYVAGFLILDRDDPSKVIQRDVVHFFRPTMDYEVGSNPAWPVYRNRTLFVTTLVPVDGETDKFIAWYGAADANVATAMLSVTLLP